MAKKQTKKKQANNKKINLISNIILGLAIVIFLAAAVLFIVHHVTNTNSSTGTSGSTEISYEEVNMEDLAKTLVKKESRAQKKYKDIYVKMTGVVSETDPNNNYLILTCNSAEEDLAEVAFICYFDPAEEALKTQTYDVGDTVTVYGQILYISSDMGYNLTITEIQ